MFTLAQSEILKALFNNFDNIHYIPTDLKTDTGERGNVVNTIYQKGYGEICFPEGNN